MQNYAEQPRIQYLADILILTGLVMLSALIFGLLSFLLAGVMFGVGYDEFISQLTNISASGNGGLIKFYNAFSTFGAWVVSGFLLSRIRSFPLNRLWQFRSPPVRFIWVLLPVLFVACTVLSSYLLDINSRLPLPEGLVSVFDSFKTGALLEKMLQMNSSTDLFVNLLVIALLPAVFEEIFFRGTLQNLLNGLFRNNHAGIWVGSFIFALIHLNIYQMIPMMFLALVFGYLVNYTGSIFPSIMLHFLNNALAVTAYYYREQSEFARKITEDEFSPGIGMFVAGLAVVVTIFAFLIQQHNLQLHDHHE